VERDVGSELLDLSPNSGFVEVPSGLVAAAAGKRA